MPRIASALPLVGGLFGLLLFMGGSQAALYRVVAAEKAPHTEGERALYVCASAAQLLREDQPQQAIALLQCQAYQPFALPPPTTVIADFTPASQVLSLAMQLRVSALHAAAHGQQSWARAYLQQCYALSKRLQQTKQSDPEVSLRVAERIELAARRIEASLERPSQSLPRRSHRPPGARRAYPSVAS